MCPRKSRDSVPIWNLWMFTILPSFWSRSETRPICWRGDSLSGLAIKQSSTYACTKLRPWKTLSMNPWKVSQHFLTERHARKFVESDGREDSSFRNVVCSHGSLVIWYNQIDSQENSFTFKVPVKRCVWLGVTTWSGFRIQSPKVTSWMSIDAVLYRNHVQGEYSWTVQWPDDSEAYLLVEFVFIQPQIF